MSFNQISIPAFIAEKKKEKQEKCRHDLVFIPAIDHERDEVFYFGVCRHCGYKTD